MSDVITLITAPAGSGKSWSRVRQLVEEILPDTDAHVYTNLPLKVQAIAEHVAQNSDHAAADIEERIHLIPAQEIEKWRFFGTGPWDYFKETDLNGAVIIIDEAHEVCSKKGHKLKHRAEWQRWLGQIRHRGCTVQLITQHKEKIAEELLNEVGVRRELVNVETSRDPFFKIKVGDWYELRAAFITKEIRPCIWEIERRMVDGKAKISDSHRFPLKAKYFSLYDSYSAPEHGGKKGEAPKREFERRSKWGVLRWFVLRNWWRFGRSVAIAGAMLSVPFVVPRLVSHMTGVLRARQIARGAVAPERSAASTGAPETAGDANGPSDATAQKRTTAAEYRPPGRADVLHGITDGEALFRDGGRVQVGEVIHYGTYRGRKVEAIDWVTRGVAFDDGSVLRVGAPTVLQEWKAGERPSRAVHEPLRSIGQAGDRGPPEPAAAEVNHLVVPRNESGGFLPSVGGQGSDFRSVGRKLR